MENIINKLKAFANKKIIIDFDIELFGFYLETNHFTINLLALILVLLFVLLIVFI